MQLVVKDVLGNQCTFLPWLSGHCIIHRARLWSGYLLWGRVGAPASWASGYFGGRWGRRRQQVGIMSTSDSQLKDCTVWQADRENWWFPTLGLFVRFRQTEKKKKKTQEKQGLVSRSCQHHTPIVAPLPTEMFPLPPGSLVLCAHPPLSVWISQ